MDHGRETGERSAAYDLAASRRPALLKRFQAVLHRLTDPDCRRALRSFQTVLAEGRVSINMSVRTGWSFLTGGHYLNVYEFVRWDQGLSGPELEQGVLDRLKDLGPPRRKLDTLFGFQEDTHYATFNLGGAGADRYGACCFVFDLRHWAPFHTCFAGDSIRACFSARKEQVLSDEEILASFAIGEDLERLAVIQNEDFLLDQKHGVLRSEVVGLFADDDSFLEVHLHGPVLREQIQEVRFPMDRFRKLERASRRLNASSGPLPWSLDDTEPFRGLLDLLDRYEIPIVLVDARG